MKTQPRYLLFANYHPSARAQVEPDFAAELDFAAYFESASEGLGFEAELDFEVELDFEAELVSAPDFDLDFVAGARFLPTPC
jgi:hypothetical protein